MTHQPLEGSVGNQPPDDFPWNVTAFASPLGRHRRKSPRPLGLWDSRTQMAMKMADLMGLIPDPLPWTRPGWMILQIVDKLTVVFWHPKQ